MSESTVKETGQPRQRDGSARYHGGRSISSDSAAILLSNVLNKGANFALLAVSFRSLSAASYADLVLAMQGAFMVIALTGGAVSILTAKFALPPRSPLSAVRPSLIWACVWCIGLGLVSPWIRANWSTFSAVPLVPAISLVFLVLLRNGLFGGAVQHRCSATIRNSAAAGFAASLLVMGVVAAVLSGRETIGVWLLPIGTYTAVETTVLFCNLRQMGGKAAALDRKREAFKMATFRDVAVPAMISGSVLQFAYYALTVRARSSGDTMAVAAFAWGAQLRAPLLMWCGAFGFSALARLARSKATAGGALGFGLNVDLRRFGRSMGLLFVGTVCATPIALLALGDAGLETLWPVLLIAMSTLGLGAVTLTGSLLVGVNRDWLAALHATLPAGAIVVAGASLTAPTGLSLAFVYTAVLLVWCPVSLGLMRQIMKGKTG